MYEMLERGEEEVERAQRTFSKQPRFRDNGTDVGWSDSFYANVYTWLKHSKEELEEEPYQMDSRTRDTWLSEIWKIEPHWSGIIDQIVLVDSARPWTFIGGKKQVNRYANILHNANDGQGWRHFFRQCSLAYRTTDMGVVTELGRQGRGGPLRGIYFADPTKCKLSGRPKYPIWYYPGTGRYQKRQAWRKDDFFHIASLPSINEKFHGLGWCATSRAFNLVKLLYGVLMHDQELVGAKMPRGLLFINGIEQAQWEQAMQSREAQMEASERKYFGGVYIIASAAGGATGELMALSMLPDHFDREAFVNLTVYGYSLVSGYDPREFWPVSSGQLGTARETEMQHKKSATKGTLELPHAWQERFQQELPETLHFSFQERDTDAETHLAELATVWSEVARILYDGDRATGREGLLDSDRALSLLVEHSVIPPEWTAAQESTKASDEKKIRSTEFEKARALPEVRAAAQAFPTEPIVMYTWDGIKAVERVLWQDGFEMNQPKLWQVHKRYKTLPLD